MLTRKLGQNFLGRKLGTKDHMGARFIRFRGKKGRNSEFFRERINKGTIGGKQKILPVGNKVEKFLEGLLTIFERGNRGKEGDFNGGQNMVKNLGAPPEWYKDTKIFMRYG